MTTRNFRVHNGISVGDIVINAATNKITGGATAAPSADGDFSNKKYVDDSIAAISTTAINQGNSNVTVTDSGTGAITVNADGTETLNMAKAATTITAATGAINLTAATDVVIPANIGLTFGTGEKIEGDSTDLTVTSGGKINLTATTDIVVPANVGITFGTGEKIEGDSTDLTVTSGAKINLTAVSDVHIPKNVGIVFDDNASEKIESNDTDLTVTSGAAINLTATTDVVLPANVGITFGTGEKIEGDNTDLTITSGGAINLASGNTVAVTGALTVTGDLTVNGTTTTVATSNTTIADNLIELNTGISASSNDAGLIIERGSTGNNAAIIWDESADKFAMGLTTATAADKSGGITVATGTLLANLEGNVTGALTGNADTATVGTTITAADESSDTSCNVLFVTAATGNLPAKTGTNLTFNSSSGMLTAPGFTGDLTGTATAAQYSDVAERFASDSAYTPGTVVALGGAEEITQVNEEGSDEVFGVISSLDQAAFKMNGGAGNDDTHPYIAMTGRVDVKVIGSVNKGDRLISASVPGYAKAATKAECTAFNVIGRALTGKTEAGQGSVLAAVRVSH